MGNPATHAACCLDVEVSDSRFCLGVLRDSNHGHLVELYSALESLPKHWSTLVNAVIVEVESGSKAESGTRPVSTTQELSQDERQIYQRSGPDLVPISRRGTESITAITALKASVAAG